MKAKESFSMRTYVLWAAMLAVWFGVGVLLVPVATHKRLIAPAFAGEGFAFPKAQNALAHTAPLPTQPDPAARGRVLASYGKLPLSFEPNQGQTDGQVKFLSRGSGYTLYLTAQEAVLALRKASAPNPAVAAVSSPPTRRAAQFSITNLQLLASWPRYGDEDIAAPIGATNRQSSIANRQSVLTMNLVGANQKARVVGLEELPGKSNYFIGNDPKQWRTNVPTYAKVRYQNVYPGVDLIYYGKQGQLEYDFVVRPGADPSTIRFSVGAGLSRHQSNQDGGVKPPLQIAADGDLVVKTDGGDVRFHKPVVYQTKSTANHQSSIDNRQLLEGHYVLTASNQLRFALGPYDRSKPLVIDPILRYSTYLGGSGDDGATGIAVDSARNAYVTGGTGSTDFPTKNPFQAANAGHGDAFVTKLDPTGSALVYSTYLGGSDHDDATGIAVDSARNAYVTGFTYSTNFPTKNPFQRHNAGGADAFVTKLDPTGSALVYSTYLGGSGFDAATGIAVDSAGNAYVTGGTASTNFPTMNPFQAANAGFFGNAFVTELSPTGSALVYSTYLGGSGGDNASGIALDSAGNAYVTGVTKSTNFPTKNPFQGTFGGGGGTVDAFVTKLDPTGSALVYSTYLGGSDNDVASGIAVDSARNAYVTGQTFSTNFPTKNPFQAANAGNLDADAFVTKLDPTGNALVYSTYLGGSGREQATGIAVDSARNAYVTGWTTSTNFPTQNPFQAANAGGFDDAFVTKLDPTGSALVYSTYLGGSNSDFGFGIALDSARNAYVTGGTSSTNFPTKNPFQGTNAGGFDAFVAKIVLAADLEITNSAAGSVTSGSTLTYTIEATNLGPDTASKVTIKDSVPAGTTFNSVGVTTGSCTSPTPGGTGTVVCALPSLAKGASVTETLMVNVTASSGSKITDTASVSSSTFDPNKTNNSARATTTVM